MSAGRFVGPSVFFICFLAYLVTLAPGVTFWDSGELTIGAFSLGLSHPPAYPLFCMTGKLFTWLPFGNVAYRTNLLSAFFGAASVYLLYFLIREMVAEKPGGEWLAGACAMLFGFYRSFWGVSVITEVYTLNTFLILAALIAILFYEKKEDARSLLLSSLLVGLALANHQSAVFFLPPYAAYFLLSGRNYKKAPLLAAGAFFFLLAYALNIYLPIRASSDPLLNIGDPVIFPWFAWVLKWGEYAEFLKGLFVANLTPAKVLAAAAGAGALGALVYAMRRRPFLLLLACLSALYFAGTHLLTGGAAAAQKLGLTAKFFIPAVMLAVPLAAAAIAAAVSPASSKKAGGWMLKAASVLIFAGAAVLAATSFRQVDNSRNFFAYDFGMNTLKSVGKDAAIFGYGDNGVFPVWYLQKIEHYRDDVAFLYAEVMTFPWSVEETRRIMLQKYGISYNPVFSLAEVKKNIPILRLSLEKVTPTYFDYSTMRFLDAPFERLTPQGLVHLGPSWPGLPLGRIWGFYVVRGLDGSTDRKFAAEGILGIYAWEAAVWAQDAYSRGNLREVLIACEYSKKLGMADPYLDKWAEEVRKRLEKEKA